MKLTRRTLFQAVAGLFATGAGAKLARAKPQARLGAEYRLPFTVQAGGPDPSPASFTPQTLPFLPYLKHPHFRVLIVGKDVHAAELWAEALAVYSARMGARRHPYFRMIVFPSGARIEIGHIDNKEGWRQYAGLEYQRIYFDGFHRSLGFATYYRVTACCRSSYPEITPVAFQYDETRGWIDMMGRPLW